jgi:hypothetical protein
MNREAWMTFIGHSLLTISFVAGMERVAAQGPEPAPAAEVQQLIQQLGDNDYLLRERASAALKTMPKAVAALRAALHSDDAEIRRRSASILAAISHQQMISALEKMRLAKKDGKIDLFVEYATILRAHLTNRRCPLYDLAEDVVREARRHLQDDEESDDVTLLNLGWMRRAIYISPERCFEKDAGENQNVIVTNSVSFDDLVGDRGIVSRDGVVAGNSFGYSLILSNGNAVVRGEDSSIEHCLILCDGDVEVDTIWRSVVVARGRVRYKKRDDDSLIIEGDRAALGKFSFFELSDVGLQVTEKPALAAKVVKKDNAFARSGFQAGDRLLTANGKKIESANDFRRTVRRHLAESVLEPKPLPVQVERAGKKIDLSLEFD